MDFSQAIQHHMAWVKEMLVNIQSPATLNPEDIARDDLCEIGKWIYEIDPQYHDLPEYRELRDIHKELHRSTAEAVVMAKAGNIDEAKQYLSVEGELIDTSKRLLECCSSLIAKMDS